MPEAQLIYQAIRPFTTEYQAQRVFVRRGDTVAAGHWLLAINPDAFRILTPKFDVEKTAAKPSLR